MHEHIGAMHEHIGAMHEHIGAMHEHIGTMRRDPRRVGACTVRKGWDPLFSLGVLASFWLSSGVPLRPLVSAAPIGFA
jgi:hypothetical protein